MKRRLCRLSAVDELKLPGDAQNAMRYLQLFCADQEHTDELWAVANNAALVALSAREGGRPAFADAQQVLQQLSLLQIAGLARAYQRMYEGDAR